MTRNLAYPVAAIMLVCSLAACAGSATAQTDTSPSPAPTLTPTLTVASTPTLSPTLALLLTGTLPSPPPPPFSSTLITDDFLFGDSTPACELPCWHGIVPGQSGRGDVQRLFDTVFGFKGRDVFVYNVIPSRTPGIILVSEVWSFGEEDNDSFEVIAVLDQETEILHELILGVVSQKFGETITPINVIGKLGQPLDILAAVETTQQPDYGILNLLMIYQRGVSFRYVYYGVKIINKPSDNDIRESTVEFCFGESNALKGKNVVLFPPLLNGLDNLTSFQKSGTTDYIDTFQLRPLQDISNISVEEATRRILQEGDLCVSISFEYVD